MHGFFPSTEPALRAIRFFAAPSLRSGLQLRMTKREGFRVRNAIS